MAKFKLMLISKVLDNIFIPGNSTDIHMCQLLLIEYKLLKTQETGFSFIFYSLKASERAMSCVCSKHECR